MSVLSGRQGRGQAGKRAGREEGRQGRGQAGERVHRAQNNRGQTGSMGKGWPEIVSPLGSTGPPLRPAMTLVESSVTHSIGMQIWCGVNML